MTAIERPVTLAVLLENIDHTKWFNAEMKLHLPHFSGFRATLPTSEIVLIFDMDITEIDEEEIENGILIAETLGT